MAREEQLLKLIALELAWSRLNSTASPHNAYVIAKIAALSEAAEQLQCDEELLPAAFRVKSLGVNVSFMYTNWQSQPIEPSSGERKTLEIEAWKDSQLSEMVLTAHKDHKAVVVYCRLNYPGATPSGLVKDYVPPTFTLTYRLAEDSQRVL